MAGEELVSVLRDLGPRQWQATVQLLIEAKYKAESMLRDPAVIASPSQTAYYVGWVSYADFVLASFERLRAGDTDNRLPDDQP